MTTDIATPVEEKLVLNLVQDMKVQAPIATTFEAILEQLGPGADTPDGRAMPMKLEAWPGGRWFRDLGDNNGHFWGQVQAIKRPTLIELVGPLFLSHAVISTVQYRLSEIPGGTLIAFHHFAFGTIPDDVRKGLGTGWGHIMSSIRSRAEKAS